MAGIGTIRTLWYPKNIDAPETYEDASCFNQGQSTFVVADGVSSAIFSKQWAKVLVRETADNWLPLDDSKAVSGWIRPLRRQWSDELPKDMEWFQKEKLAQTGGAYATLLGVQLDFTEFNLRSFSFGDCCLFLFRDGHVVGSFPASDSAYFGITPYSLPSSRQPREQFEPELYECDFQIGDKVLLATDAIACWIFSRLEEGEAIDLQMFETFEDGSWTSFIEDLRAKRRIRVDDVTVQLTEITAEGPGDSIIIGPVPYTAPGSKSIETPRENGNAIGEATLDASESANVEEDLVSLVAPDICLEPDASEITTDAIGEEKQPAVELEKQEALGTDIPKRTATADLTDASFKKQSLAESTEENVVGSVPSEKLSARDGDGKHQNTSATSAVENKFEVDVALVKSENAKGESETTNEVGQAKWPLMIAVGVLLAGCVIGAFSFFMF